MNAQLFPKPRRTFRMKQPRKDAIRWRAELGEARAAYAEAALAETDARCQRLQAVLVALLIAVLLIVPAVLARVAGWLPIGGAA